MEQNCFNPNQENGPDINVLLLGESGVGKSTFINSIANYHHFQYIEQAMREELICLIPQSFQYREENGTYREIVVGSQQLVENSPSKEVKEYSFHIQEGRNRLRLIDTPGVGNSGDDDITWNNIVSHICQLDYLNAICLFFKTNDANIISTFIFYIKQIFSRLEHSAATNIIFIFTYARVNNYRLGENAKSLRKIVMKMIGEPLRIDIKISDNVFWFENDAFKFLAALKNGIQFTAYATEEYFKSWRHSFIATSKFISYIAGDKTPKALVPHNLQASKAAISLWRAMNSLSQPLADITTLILDNLHVLELKQKELEESCLLNERFYKVKEKLCVPVINLDVTKLEKPATVCCATKCPLNLNGRTSFNPMRMCHETCDLSDFSQDIFGILGAPELRNCTTINSNTRTCNECRCSPDEHMHICYTTKRVGDRTIIDQHVIKGISTRVEVEALAMRLRQEIRKKKAELEYERDVIIHCAARFSGFLQKHSIKSYIDGYRNFMNFINVRDRNQGAKLTNNYLEIHLANYDEIRKVFNKIRELPKNNGIVIQMSVEDFETQLNTLRCLKYNGRKLMELYSIQMDWIDKISRENKTERLSRYHQTHGNDENTTRRNEQDTTINSYDNNSGSNLLNTINKEKQMLENGRERNDVTVSDGMYSEPDARRNPSQMHSSNPRVSTQNKNIDRIRNNQNIPVARDVSNDYQLFPASSPNQKYSLSQNSQSDSYFSVPNKSQDEQDSSREVFPANNARSSHHSSTPLRDHGVSGEIHHGAGPPYNSCLNIDVRFSHEFSSPYQGEHFNDPSQRMHGPAGYHQPPPSAGRLSYQQHSTHNHWWLQNYNLSQRVNRSSNEPRPCLDYRPPENAPPPYNPFQGSRPPYHRVPPHNIRPPHEPNVLPSQFRYSYDNRHYDKPVHKRL